MLTSTALLGLMMVPAISMLTLSLLVSFFEQKNF